MKSNSHFVIKSTHNQEINTKPWKKLTERKNSISFFIPSRLFHFCVIYVCVAKRQKGKVYLYEKDTLIKKITYNYEEGTESEPLPRYIHLGMFTDSILFGEKCQIRFFIYPFSLRLYDTDVDCLEFING